MAFRENVNFKMIKILLKPIVSERFAKISKEMQTPI
jgi:hypothetical protein